MPGASRAEFYFISAMMLLILILCVGAVYIFFRTYKKEMRERAGREANESQSEVDVASASPNKEPAGER